MPPVPVHELLSAVDWITVGRRLALYGTRRLRRFGHRDAAAAEDLSMEAITRTLDLSDPRATWDPQRRSLEEHLRYVLRGLVSNRITLVRFKTHGHDPDEVYRLPGGETDLDVQMDAHRCSELVLRLLKGPPPDELATVMFEQMRTGEYKSAILQTSMACSRREVYNTRKRLDRVFKTVRATLTEAETPS